MIVGIVVVYSAGDISGGGANAQDGLGPKAFPQAIGLILAGLGLWLLLSEPVARLLGRPGWAERMGAAQVASRWTEIVGADLAQHCEPVRTAGRVLTVRAESSAWATQLRYFTTHIAEQVDAVLGAGSVTEVRIVVGPLEGAGGPDVRHHGGAPTVRPDEEDPT